MLKEPNANKMWSGRFREPLNRSFEQWQRRLPFSFVCLSIALPCACSSSAQTRCPQDRRSDKSATQFIIGNDTIVMPVGAFLLIRKDSGVGAIRLTNLDHLSEHIYGSSTYESFYNQDMSAKLGSGKTIKRTGDLSIQRLRGVSHSLMYQPGEYKARVGPWRFAFLTPFSMAMSDTSFWHGGEDNGYEFAPTSACDLSQINVNDKRLRWFRFSKDAQLVLPLEDLAK